MRETKVPVDLIPTIRAEMITEICSGRVPTVEHSPATVWAAPLERHYMIIKNPVAGRTPRRSGTRRYIGEAASSF